VVNLPNGNQAAQAQPVQMFYRDIWNAYYSAQVNNPAGVSMSLASNTVIVPPRVAQGANNLQMALTCSTAVAGPGGQLPSVTVPEGDITIDVLGMTNVNYAAPGNSYPSDFQLLFLNVTVDRNAAPGARTIVVTNPPQSGSAPPPAAPAPAFLYVLPAIDGAR
jgi:hypothetical protein